MKYLVIILIIIIILIYLISNKAFEKILFHPNNENLYKPDFSHRSYYIYLNGYYNSEHIGPKQERYINGWLFNKYPNKEFILYFHGNYGNMNDCKRIITICKELKLNLFLIDYRGYGKSSCKPTYQRILEDGQIAYDFLLNFTNPLKIIVWGESMGGSVATHVVKHNKVKALILLSTFSCLNDIAKYGDFDNPLIKISDLITDLVSNLPICEWLQSIYCPILIGHSEEDKLINIKCAHKNYKSINHDNKKLITYSGDHAIPIITHDNITDILNFCNLTYESNTVQKLANEMMYFCNSDYTSNQINKIVKGNH